MWDYFNKKDATVKKKRNIIWILPTQAHTQAFKETNNELQNKC